MPLVGTVGTQQEKKIPKRHHKETSYRNSRQYSLVSSSSPPKRIVHRIILVTFFKKSTKEIPIWLGGQLWAHQKNYFANPLRFWQKCGREQGLCNRGYCVYSSGSKESEGVYRDQQVITRQKVSWNPKQQLLLLLSEPGSDTGTAKPPE